MDQATEATRCLVLAGRFMYHQAAPRPAATRNHGLVAAAIRRAPLASPWPARVVTFTASVKVLPSWPASPPAFRMFTHSRWPDRSASP